MPSRAILLSSYPRSRLPLPTAHLENSRQGTFCELRRIAGECKRLTESPAMTCVARVAGIHANPSIPRRKTRSGWRGG